MNKPTEIITHHFNGITGNPCFSTQHQTLYTVDDSHRNRWRGFTSKVYKRLDTNEFFHCGYHRVVWHDGDRWTWTRTRAVYEVGAHCIGKNNTSVGIAIAGNYDKCAGDEIPEEAKVCYLEALEDVQEELEENGMERILLTKNFPHRKYATKSCYGDSLSDDYFVNLSLEAQQPEEKERIIQLEQQVSTLWKIIGILQTIIVQLQNRSTPQRLSIREKII